MALLALIVYLLLRLEIEHISRFNIHLVWITDVCMGMVSADAHSPIGFDLLFAARGGNEHKSSFSIHLVWCADDCSGRGACLLHAHAALFVHSYGRYAK